ncbi:MAG: hypothetical protein ACRD1F_02520, partial [Terriglobales bacterium]
MQIESGHPGESGLAARAARAGKHERITAAATEQINMSIRFVVMIFSLSERGAASLPDRWFSLPPQS